jgi:O-antigen/teichoic acid export membrane protein
LFRQLLRLLSHSIIYGFGVAVSQIVGFFLIPLYTRYLTPSDYGVLQIISVTSSVLSVIFAMGISSALFRSYFLYDEAEKKKTIASTAFIYLTGTSAILSLLLIGLAGKFSSLLFHSAEYMSYFRIIFLTLFCDTGTQIGMSVLRAREEPFKYAVVTVARVLISVGLNIVFVVALHRGVLGILESGAITAVIIYLWLTFSVIRRAGFGFSTDELKRMLAFGLPLIPAGLATSAIVVADRYFLQFLSTSTELGLYSLGYSFGLVVNGLLVSPFLTAWVPFTFSIYRQPDARQTFSRVFTYFVLVIIFASLALSVLSKEVVAVIATPAFRTAYKVIPLIAVSYVLYGCYAILAIGISLEAKTKYVMPIIGAAAIVNLGLNYALIPDFGMMGAAWAALASFLVMAILGFIVSQRLYTVTYEWGRVAKIVIAAGVIYAGSLFIHYDESVIITGVFKLLALLAFPALLYLLRFHHPEEIQKIKEIIKASPGYLKQRLLRRPVVSGGSSNK